MPVPSQFAWLVLAAIAVGLIGDKHCQLKADEKRPAIQANQQDSKRNPPRYSFRRDHDPNGIGKFYMDREIAHVMGFVAAKWLERATREKEERTSVMIKSLKLKPGMVIADIGAGSGRISLMMAELAGPDGKVIAVDVQQKMLDLVAEKIERLQITNVELVKGTPKSTKLKPASIDLAIMVDVYHEFEFPYEMIMSISRAMKVGGRVVFVEYRKEDKTVPIKLVHKMTQIQVKKEIGLPEFRLKWKKTIGVLPWQNIIIFERQGKRKSPDAGDSKAKTGNN